MTIIRSGMLFVFLACVAAQAPAMPSSLMALYGPTLSAASPNVLWTSPGYDFRVTQFGASNSYTTAYFTIAQHQVPSPNFVEPPGVICACMSSGSPPAQSWLAFSFPETVSVPITYHPETPWAGSFDAGINNQTYTGPGPALTTVVVGQMDTTEVGGQPTLTHFAADFTVQFVTSSFEQTVDPATGGIFWVQVLTPIPGGWYAGSLRYQSDVPAFAFLSPVPEPGDGVLTALGLGIVTIRMRRRKSAARIFPMPGRPK